LVKIEVICVHGTRNLGVKMQKNSSQRGSLKGYPRQQEAITPFFLSAGDPEYAQGRSSPKWHYP